MSSGGGGGPPVRSSSALGGGTPSRLSTATSSISAPGSARAPIPKLLSDKYRLGEELGRGAYGQVYRGLDTRSGSHVAIKQLSLERIPADSLQGIMNEVELLKALNHKNIVKYLGSFRSRTHLYIILEFMENGALSTIIKHNKFGPFPESLVAVYIQQVLQGLAYLHDQGVVHRDIKGANILTTKEGVVKLADFGVAAKLGEPEAGGAEAQAPVGTPYWMAPEVVEMKSVTTAADIWSVACLAIELLTGAPPYYDLQPMSALYNIVQDKHPPLPPDISMGMHDFLLKCFQKDPASRPSARELLQHSWVTYNRRTLRSSWSRTRGLKARGARTDAHATVSTVVERMLQAETEEADAVAILEQQQAAAAAAAKLAVSEAPPQLQVPSTPQPPQAQMPQQQQQHPPPMPSLQQQPQKLPPAPAFTPPPPPQPPQMPPPAPAFLHPQQPLPPVLPQQRPAPLQLGPLARATQFNAASAARLSDNAPPAALPAAAPLRQGLQPVLLPAEGSLPAGALGAGALAAAAAQQAAAAPSQPLAAQQAVPPLSLPRQPPPQQQPAYTSWQQQQEQAAASAHAPPQQQQQQPSRQQAFSPLSHQQQQLLRQAGVAVAASRGEGGDAGEAAEQGHDPTGAALLRRLEEREAGRGPGGMGPKPALGSQDSMLAAGDVDAVARQNLLEVQRQVGSMRAPPPGERNMVQEAAAAASAKELARLVGHDPALKAAFVAADGLPALLELLDCTSERVLSPALELLLALVARDPPSLAASCALGLVPAALRLAGPGPPMEVRLAAAQYLEAVCTSGGSGVGVLVGAGGIGGLLALLGAEVEHAGGSGPAAAAQQLLMLGIGVGCLWSVLHQASLPASPVTLNQCLRQMSQRGAAAKLVRVLPRVMRERSAALEAWRASSTARHTRSSSAPQVEAEVSLLAADALAEPHRLPAAIPEQEGGGQYGGSSNSGLSGSPLRLGRPLSPSPLPSRQLRASSTSVTRPPSEPINPEAVAALRLSRLLEAIVNLLAALCHGDASVKSRMCRPDTLRALFELFIGLEPALQLRLLRGVRALSSEPCVSGALEASGAVEYLVAQLEREGEPALQEQALAALHALVQLDRGRQEQAALAQAPRALCAIIHSQAIPAATRSLAVSTLCTLAHGGPRTLEELRASDCITTLLALLREEPHQVPVLDALVTWLASDTARVEQRLLEQAALERLVLLVPTTTWAGDWEALARLLAPLLRLLERSPRLSAELSQRGLVPRVTELLGMQVKRPGAHTGCCLALLDILGALYAHHPRPKEFVFRYKVQGTLHALVHSQALRGAVLVQQKVQDLLRAFDVNLVF